MNNYDEEEIYQSFWKDIICDKDGNINAEQLKRELRDFYIMIHEVPTVYCEITDGLLSKQLYDAETVLRVFRDRFANKAAAVDYLEDDWDLITAECETPADFKKAVFEYFEIG